MHDIKGLCSLFDEFILFVDKIGQVLVYNSDFTYILSHARIKNIKLIRPNSISINDSHTIIYLVNFGAQELILSNTSFSSYQKVITTDDYGFNFFPIDCTFFKHSIYLLERGNFRIMKLSEKGEFENEFMLYQTVGSYAYEDFLIMPVNVRVTNNIIAVLDDWKYIYVYDSNGCLKQILSDKLTHSPSTKRKDLPVSEIQTFIILDNYLIFHSSNGSINVFIENMDIFKFLFRRRFSKLCVKDSKLCLFNGQLIIAFNENSGKKPSFKQILLI